MPHYRFRSNAPPEWLRRYVDIRSLLIDCLGFLEALNRIHVDFIADIWQVSSFPFSLFRLKLQSSVADNMEQRTERILEAQSPSVGQTPDGGISSYLIPLFVTVAFAFAVGYLASYLFKPKIRKEEREEEPELKSTKDSACSKTKDQKQKDGAKANKKSASATSGQSKAKDTFTHPLLVTSLKGHTGKVFDGDFSQNGRYFATCSEDRSISMWPSSEFLTDSPSKEIKHYRLNIDFDHVTSVQFSPDSKAVLGLMDNDRVLRVFKLIKKTDGNFASMQPALDLPKTSSDLLFMNIDCNGKYIMTAYQTSVICIWSLKGQLLHTLPADLGVFNDCKVSPCGRFVAASGSAPSVSVWGVNFDDNTSEFRSMERAFELKGHSNVIPAFAFSGDSTHMVSVSKDKSFRLYDINVQYKKKEEPRLVLSGTWTAEPVRAAEKITIALSNDAKCIVVGYGNDVLIMSGSDGSLKNSVESPLNGSINKVMFDPSSGFILVLGSRIVRVFRNVPGYEIAIDALKEKLKYASQDSIRQRLQQQLDDAQKLLNACKLQYHV